MVESSFRLSVCSDLSDPNLYVYKSLPYNLIPNQQVVYPVNEAIHEFLNYPVINPLMLIQLILQH